MEGTKIIGIRWLVILPVLLWVLPPRGDAATIQVECPSRSLQAAIHEAKPGDILLVSGTCNENVVITAESSRIVLDGQGKATINGSDASRNVISVQGRDITIKGFTVTGGRTGIAILSGGTALLDGNTVESTGRHGVSVEQNSFARIINNAVRNNRDNGISLGGSAFAYIGFRSPRDTTARPNTIQNNGASGINVNRASAARIHGNTISGNKRAGVAVQGTSQAGIGANIINGNGSDGILVVRNSSVSLGSDKGDGLYERPNTSGAPNSGFGIRCSISSSADGRLGTLNGSKGTKDFTASGCIDSLKP